MTFSFMVVGIGEGGGRIAQAFQEFDYKTLAINTAQSDLDGLDIPPEHKLLLKISQGGTGKNPLLVKEALTKNDHRTALKNFIEQQIRSHPHRELLYVLLCVGGGGGSGSGLANTVLDMMLEFNVPVGMIYTLPSREEDVVTKTNAVSTFQEIYNQKAINGAVSPLIIVDNDCMDRQGIPIKDFYVLANTKIAQSLHQFNSFSQLPSKYFSAVDTLDFGRLLGLGGVCSFGKMRIVDPTDFGLIKEMMSSLFVQGVNIQSAKGAAVIVQAPEYILKDQLISDCINFLFQETINTVGGGLVFRGVYEDNQSKNLDVFLVFNGMTFPQDRFNQIWEDIRAGHASVKRKEKRIDQITYEVEDNLMSTQIFQRIQKPVVTPVKMVPCNNCRLNAFKTSSHIYNGTGPSPFSSGMCPRCRGRGVVEYRES